MTSSAVADLTLEQRIARLEARAACENLMGKYVNWHAANMHRECLALFAMKTADVRAEMMWGVYEGPESIERLYPGFHVWIDGDTKGVMHMHPLTTGVVEVALDGQTAKGTWLCNGLETMSFSADEESSSAFWAWSKYAVDFILEDGEWKIWHLHVHGIFLTPFERPWTQDPISLEGGPHLLEEYLPDRPATTNWSYTQAAIYPNEPVQPAQYETFDDATAY